MKGNWQTRVALLLSLLAVVGTFLVAERVFEQVPHLEDEIAYVWQARVIAAGHLYLLSPPEPKSFLVPFVVDYEGRRFGKYPLGWPTVLSLGVRFGARAWVNPLLAGLAVWLLFRLGQMLLDDSTALLACFLLLSSPFFWLNAASLLSHLWGMVLTLGFALGWLDGIAPGGKNRHSWLPLGVSALSLGVLALSRPFSALGVALPFALHALYLLVRGSPATRRRIWVFAALAGLVAGLHLVWQYALTGDFLRNPYTLWWEYDRVGFGPGHGVLPEGHTLAQAWKNTRFSLWVGAADLFGWGRLSWVLLLPGLWAAWRERRLWLVGGIFPSLVVLYLAYWVGAWLFGPRYYFEGLPGLVLWSAAGVRVLAGGGLEIWKRQPPAGESVPLGTRLRFGVRWRPLGVLTVLVVLFALNARFYIPPRLALMQNLYTINRERLKPFTLPQAQSLTPALVFVETKHWMPYGALLELESPDLRSPFIFALDIGPRTNLRVRQAFPQRRVVHYNPDEPYVFRVDE